MSSTIKPGFFTLGVRAEDYHLPHPRLGLPVILLIRRVLLRAFELLREQNCDFASAKEDDVTTALCSIIENRLRQSGKEVPGFNKLQYETVIRGGHWANHDGTRLTKTPDLCFKLRNNEPGSCHVIPEYNGLFVEAKIVDSTRPVGSQYCDNGLIRFVRGDYAWAMQQGMMLAYSRNGRTIAGHLTPAMADADRMESLATISLPKACEVTATPDCPEVEALHISLHKRNFSWPDDKGPATDITVYHLWHRCSA